MKEDKFCLLKLYSKDKGVSFTKEELLFIKKKLKITNYKIIYGWWKNEKSTKPLGYIIDGSAYAPRRSPFFNSIDIIYSRSPNKKEFHWICENYGSGNRRFTCYWYDNLIGLKQDDSKFDIETPIEVINYAKEKGLNKGFQTNIFQNNI